VGSGAAPPYEYASAALTPEQLAALPVGQMTPFAEELLAQPVELEGCPGVRIVEWRPTSGREATTGPTPAAVSVLSAVCAVAIDAFDAFVAVEVPFPVPAPADVRVDVSLLPTGSDGPVARTLADHDGRFARRDKTFTHDGAVHRIGGYTDFASGQVFVRHDVLTGDGSANAYVAMIFAHELFHAMSWQSGLFMTHGVPRGEADERLARRFTASLGLDE